MDNKMSRFLTSIGLKDIERFDLGFDLVSRNEFVREQVDMYMVKKTNGTRELNIIVETKGVDTPANLRGVEEKKISCAKKFFNQLREDYPELNVNFRDQLNNQQLRTIIGEVLREHD